MLKKVPSRVRKNWTSELFGDYGPDNMLIRLWMRTAFAEENQILSGRAESTRIPPSGTK